MALPTPPTITNRSYFQNSRSWGLEVVLLIAVIILGYFFLIKPKHVQLAAAKSSLQDLQSQQNNLETDTRTLNNLIAQLKGDPTDVSKLDEALPLNSRVTILQLLLNQLVAQAGMVPGDISVTQVNQGVIAGDKALLSNPFAADRELKIITGTISTSGTMDQLHTLLQNLENAGRILDVTNLEVSPGKDNLSFRIQFQAYAYEQ